MPTPDLFEKSLEFVSKWEGGFSDDKFDPGGKTKYGISQKSYPKLDIANLTKETAKEIYRRDFWIGSGCDRLAWPLCLVVFDTAVNCGTFRARAFLDMAIKNEPDRPIPWYLNRRRKYYQDISTKNPKLKRFLVGWMNRMKDLESVAGSAV